MDANDAEFLKKLGKQIAKIRKSKGYSQDRLYLEAGFSRGTSSKIENGLVNPQILTLRKIADTIGVSLSALVEMKGSEVAYLRAAEPEYANKSRRKK
jgi:transcriptional regulator with XRE-family HTH domain